MNVALFTKVDKPKIKEVIKYLKKHFKEVAIYRGQRGEPFPAEAFETSVDVLISYLSPWIIPRKILDRTKIWNINFHPGPPEYPGIGCFNFAIYNNEKAYGVTAHLIEQKVDRGQIIAVKRFQISKSDSIYTLSMKSYDYMLSLFYETMDFILTKGTLPNCKEVWKRIPYTRRQLEALCKIDFGMAKSEVERRIKATRYPNMPGTYIDLYGYHFEYVTPDKKVDR